MRVFVGIVVAVVLLAIHPALLGGAGLVWGLSTLGRAERAVVTKQRRLATMSIVCGLVLVASSCAGPSSDSAGDVDAAPAAPIAALPSGSPPAPAPAPASAPTTSAAPVEPTVPVEPSGVPSLAAPTTVVADGTSAQPAVPVADNGRVTAAPRADTTPRPVAPRAATPTKAAAPTKAATPRATPTKRESAKPVAPKVTPKPAPQPAPKRATPKPAPKVESGKCNIKGNINNKGEKIYHVPGGRSYDKTVIDTSKGERWFCSTSDAEAAGWRAAKA